MRVCKYLNQRIRGISKQNEKSFKGVSETNNNNNNNNNNNKKAKRLSFITQCKIEFLLRLPVLIVEKCSEKWLGIEIFDIYLMEVPDLF